MHAYKARILYDGNSVLKDVYVVVENTNIVEVTQIKPECEVVECEVITPAFIDGHSHIGMARHGEPYEEDETNDILAQIIPSNNPLNSIYFDDRAFEEAVNHGVLYSIVVPGSGNLVGGQAILVRNFARNRAEGFVRQVGYKMALGHNPRSTTSWKGTRPSTRMGVYAMLEARLERLKAKLKLHEMEKERKRKKLQKMVDKGKMSREEMENELKEMEEEFQLSLSVTERHLISLLRREKLAKVHVHKEDDVLYLLELKKKFGINFVADHLCDVFRRDIFNLLAKEGVPVTYGPIDAFAYKVELKHESYRNVKQLVESNASYCLMTDHPVVLARNLFLQTRYLLMYGKEKHEVIGVSSKKAAEIHGFDDILGTVEKGKLASFLIWDGDPFVLGSKVVGMVVEGEYTDVEH